MLDRSRENNERPSTLGTTICPATGPIELQLAKPNESQAAAEGSIIMNVYPHRTFVNSD